MRCPYPTVHIDHKSSVPFPSGSVSKPTLVYGHLPLKSSTGNSHQAFKEIDSSTDLERPDGEEEDGEDSENTESDLE